MKHFKKFNDFISNNVIYHTVYENKDAFIIGNNLYYDNQQFVLNYTPIYESVSKRFVMLNENILSDIGSGIKNVASKVGNFVWDQIKLPSSDISTFDGMIEWGHYITSMSSLLSMIIGLTGSVFTFGGSIAGSMVVAKTIDCVDISLYLIEAGKYVTDGNYMKAALPIVFAGISASLLFTTPEGNSAVIRYLQKGLVNIGQKFKPKSLREGIEIVLEQPAIKSKFKNGFKALISIIDDILDKMFPKIYLLAKGCAKIPVAIGKKIGNFFMKLVDMCRKAWSKIKSLFTNNSNKIINVYLKDSKALNSIFSVEDLVKISSSTSSDKSRKLLIDVFENLAKTKDISYLKGVIPVEKLGMFIKNAEKLSPELLGELPHIIEKSNLAKHIGDYTTAELEILCKNKKLLDIIDFAPDLDTMKKYISWSKYINPDSLDGLIKLNKPELLDIFTSNGGDYFETFTNKAFKNLDNESKKIAFDAFTKNLSKGIKTNYKKVDLKTIDINDFTKKVFENEGSIVFDGRVFNKLEDFNNYMKNDKVLGGLTKTLDIFSWQIISRGATPEKQNEFEKGLCPPNDMNTILVKEKATNTIEYIKIKPASERTPEQSTLIKEYLKYIIEASQILKNDNRFKQTVDSMAVNYLDTPKDKESYDLSNEANYVNCAKLFQGYINQYSGQAEKLSVDGAIGEKTLNAAYKFFNEVTMKDKDGKTIKTGTERANKTKELLEKLK